MNRKTTVTAAAEPVPYSRFTLQSGLTAALTPPDPDQRVWCFLGTWLPDETQPSIDHWNAGGVSSYSPETWVRNNGAVYYCYSFHVPDTDSEPGIGVNWQYYWRSMHVEFAAHTAASDVHISSAGLATGTQILLRIEMLPSASGGATALHVYDSRTLALIHSFNAGTTLRTVWALVELSELNAEGENPAWRVLAHYDADAGPYVNYAVPPEVTSAVNMAVNSAVTGLLEDKGNLNCSANPNYPAANKGDIYQVSVAGRIGGASGPVVSAGDWIRATENNSGGTHAGVGGSWSITEANIPGITSAGLTLLTGATAAAQRQSLGVDAGDSPQFTAVNVGHASDTTLSRAAAGVLSIEGNLHLGATATSVQNNVAIAAAHSGQSNSSLVLTPLGTGAIIFGPPPDNGVTGGAARGAGAVCLQTSHSVGSSTVASGTGAVAIGQNNIASNSGSVCIGFANYSYGSQAVALGYQTTAGGASSFVAGQGGSAAGNFSTVTGQHASAPHHGERAFAAGIIAALGDAQFSELIWRGTTTNDTATEIFLDGSSAKATLTTGKAWAFEIMFLAKQRSSANAAKLVRSGLIVNHGGTTALNGTIAAEGTDITASLAVSVTVDAQDTGDYLRLRVTGLASTTIDWVAVAGIVQVGN